MDRKTLKALERHAQAAADIIAADVTATAADVLADANADPADSLAALVDAAILYRIARDARDARTGS